MSELRSIIILAGGKGTRWGNYTGKPKHFLKVDGETLIARLVRLAKQHAPEAAIFIVGPKLAFPCDGVTTIAPRRILGTDHDKLIGAQEHWATDGRTLVMWGDVWLSDAGAATMFRDDSEPVLWFGRLGPSAVTGKRYGEFWGVSFEADQHKRFVKAATAASEKFRAGKVKRDNSWSIYAQMTGAKQRGLVYDRAECWREIDDFTEDFDFPIDWDRWWKAWVLRPRWEPTEEDLARVGRNFCLISLTRDQGCSAWRHIIATWGYKYDWKYMEVGGCSELTQGRSEGMSAWLLQTDKLWSLWLDDDMVIRWPDLMRFCITALNNADKLDILLGVAVSKNKKSGKICCFPFADEITIGDGGDVLGAKGGGLALAAVNRDVCMRVAAISPKVRYSSGTPGWPFFASLITKYPDDPECPNRHNSEDISFCWRVERVKGRMFADTRIRVGHKGPYVYYPEDAVSEVELQPTLHFKVR